MEFRLSPSTGIARVATSARRRLGTSPLENRLLGGLYWTVLGTAASRGALLVASLVLARLLGRDSFGEFGAIESTIGMFAVFGNLGLSLSAIKFVAKYEHSDPAKAGRILALCHILSVAAGAAATIALNLAAPWLASSALASPQLTTNLQIAALVLVLSAIHGTFNGVMLGLQAFRTNGWANVAVGAASLPILVGGALLGGIRGAVVGLVVVQAIQVATMSFALWPIAKARGLRPIWRGCFGECGTLLGFSLAALVNSSLVAPVNWLLVTLVVNYGGGYGELGLFQVANTWFLVLLFVPGKLSQVYYPLIEELLARDETAQARAFVWKLIRMNFVLFGVFALVATVASRWILQCYGPEYLAARPALVLTVWTAVCVAATQPLTALVFAHSRMWQISLSTFCWAGVTLAMGVELLDYGATGAASARLTGYVVYAALMAAITLRLLGAHGEQAKATSPTATWLESAPAQA
jgi:O-antigen/teichoic acid export membrane protein